MTTKLVSVASVATCDARAMGQIGLKSLVPSITEHNITLTSRAYAVTSEKAIPFSSPRK